MILIRALTASAQETWIREVLDMPESALVDSVKEQFLVSDFVGHREEIDANSYLFQESLHGSLIEHEWFTTLDTPRAWPKGHELYVADVGRLDTIDVETGLIMGSLAPDGALYLHVITCNASAAWVCTPYVNARWSDCRTTTHL